nr:glycoside hydrolase family 3 N-terminal domain-containing protein [Aestuariimicrobium ganziense]
MHAPHELSDQQRDLLLRDHIRHVLVIGYANVDTAVTWHNAMQQLAEEQPFGIPVNFSTDPRHGASDSGAEFKSSGAVVSKWPEGLGMAAIGSAERVRQFADIVRQEYRALGFCTALGPQIDLATEPRWMHAVDTFGGDVEQVIAFTRAYLDALQTTPGADGAGAAAASSAWSSTGPAAAPARVVATPTTATACTTSTPAATRPPTVVRSPRAPSTSTPPATPGRRRPQSSCPACGWSRAPTWRR